MKSFDKQEFGEFSTSVFPNFCPFLKAFKKLFKNPFQNRNISGAHLII
jgi:hypothetical protein